MLKSSELRIGNWVYLPSKKWQYQISSGQDIEEIEDSGDAEPIEITPHRLEMFGFHRRTGLGGNVFYSLHTGSIELEWDEDSMGVAIEGQFLTVEHVKHVHQLQNLYFAITGKELELVTTPQHS